MVWKLPRFESDGANLHLFQTRFVISWENNRDGDVTMPLSLKTIGSAGYRDQWNKGFGWVQVNQSDGFALGLLIYWGA